MNNKKKIGAITFHSSYNHGSCLQAYALQKYITSTFLNVDYSIINFRTKRQKDYYTLRDKNILKRIVKRLILIGQTRKIKERFKKYENFIANRLQVTEEYETINDLRKANFDYDIYLSGSDQIWNLAPLDFDWAYYLEFCHNAKKISYAASFGQNEQSLSEQQRIRIRKDLDDYDFISIREKGSAENIKKITGKNPSINIDPTLLIKKEEWSKLAGDKNVGEKYIFLYDVKESKEAYEVANKLSKKLGLPVIIVRESARLHHVYRNFIKRYDAGPVEFLNLIKNAELVVSSSFHGTVFSIIFQKPFFAIDNGKDKRLNDLLENTGLEDRRVTSQNIDDKYSGIFDIDFSKSEKYIKQERENSKLYLRNALRVKEKKSKEEMVSIVIPLYNSEKFITDCIKSCQNQTYDNIEIIVVDDGSTDAGYGIVDKIAKKDSRIRLFHTSNGGVSSARNTGIEKSRGEYICFVDADDSIENNFVEKMLEYLRQSGADFCFSKNTFEQCAQRKEGYVKITSAEAEELLLSQRIYVGCWNKMYKKDLVKNIRFRNDLFYGEGLYFINQVANNARKIIVCEDGLYHYRKVNPESATTKFNIEKMINGEKSLLDIKAMLKANDKRVNRMWSQHYCLFCLNAMRGLIKDHDEKYKDWLKKLRKNTYSGIRAKGNFKIKAKIAIGAISPKLLQRIIG